MNDANFDQKCCNFQPSICKNNNFGNWRILLCQQAHSGENLEKSAFQKELSSK